MFIIYGGLKSALAIADIEIGHPPEWQSDHKMVLDITFGILRHGGYCLNNLAFTFNVSRWTRILNECKAVLKRESVQKSQRGIFIILTGAVAVMIVAAVSFAVVQASGVLTSELDLYFYGYQGLVIHPFIIIGYGLAYRSLRTYHNNLC